MHAAQAIHLSDVVGALSLALDITEGQPVGHALRCCWIGMHLGERIGLSPEELSDLYYTLLLKDIGCSSNAARICRLYLTDDLSFKGAYKFVDTRLPEVMRFLVAHTGRNSGMIERLQAMVHIARNGGEIARELVETRCHRGADIARSMRFSDAVAHGILDLDEHWDGTGQPLRRMREEISIFSRIALLSQVVDVFFMRGGASAAIAEARTRSGRWFDPVLVETLESFADRPDIWAAMRSNDLVDRVSALEPQSLVREIDESYLDDIAAGFAKVVDAKSPYTAGHSDRVALFSDLIAEHMGYDASSRRTLRRAALLHDIGKLGVSNTILDNPGRPSAEDWAEIKRHPEMGRNILLKIAALKDTATIAGSHHERLDGRGYPLGLKSPEINMETRIVATADVFDALTADRPYRKAMSVSDALAIMRKDIDKAIDRRCYNALVQGLNRMQDIAA